MTDRQRAAKIARARRLAVEAAGLLDQVLEADRDQLRHARFDYDGEHLARAAAELDRAAGRLTA